MKHMTIALDVDSKIPGLIDLGFTPAQADALERMMNSCDSGGVIVVAGEANAGVSTTLKSVISMLVERSRPRESLVASGGDGSEDRNEVIAALVRSALGVLMVGELKDGHAARAVGAVARAGNTVVTRLRAGSALGIVPGLARLGLDHDTLCHPGFLRGLVRQVLLPRLCASCRVPHDEAVRTNRVDAGLAQRIDQHFDHCSHLLFHRGPGCSTCHESPDAKVLCAEVVLPDPAVIELAAAGEMHAAHQIARGDLPGATRHAHAVSCEERAIDLMRAGVVAPADVEACFGPFGLMNKPFPA